MQDGTYLVKADGSIVNYGERWAYGYFVADGMEGAVIGTQHESGALENVIYDVARASAGNLVGVWTSGNTVYIDPVNHISDRASAIKLGTERGEFAIWDARDNVAITL